MGEKGYHGIVSHMNMLMYIHVEGKRDISKPAPDHQESAECHQTLSSWVGSGHETISDHQESAECHQTLSSWVGSGHETISKPAPDHQECV